MTDVNYAEQPPELIRAQWNRLAIVAFILPIAVFVLVQVAGWLIPLPTVAANATTADIVRAATPRGLTFGIIELVVCIVAVVLAHLSLRQDRRALRGRGFGIAGAILGYIGIVLALLGIVSVLVLPYLINQLGSLS